MITQVDNVYATSSPSAILDVSNACETLILKNYLVNKYGQPHRQAMSNRRWSGRLRYSYMAMKK